MKKTNTILLYNVYTFIALTKQSTRTVTIFGHLLNIFVLFENYLKHLDGVCFVFRSCGEMDMQASDNGRPMLLQLVWCQGHPNFFLGIFLNKNGVPS